MRKFFVLVFSLIAFCAKAQQGSYDYRGMHLDVARHFFSKQVVEQFIDTLSACNINYFHWHLTDDQGWRIEIKKYPLLTQVGAWRVEKDSSVYGGFYTQQDIKEVVAYAAARNITIIPEIDLPGHSTAAIAAYPFLSCVEQIPAVSNHWGIHKDILSPSDTTFKFLFAVFDEVCELFPSHYIHIGGDEVPKAYWKQNTYALKIKAQQGYKDFEGVQHYFMKTIEAYLNSKGRRCIMWGEALRGGVSDSTIIMSWRGRGAGIKAAKQGRQVIMAPRFTCYFDYPQTIKDKKPAWWMTYIPYKKVLKFNPQVKSLSKEQNALIMGGECTLWTEYITNEAELWRQLMPRLRAFGLAMQAK